MTVNRTWQVARRLAFTPEVEASPLAHTPYDLRHAAVSTLLNAGVPPTVVAEVAGQSVEVLLKIYAKCLHGGKEALRQIGILTSPVSSDKTSPVLARYAVRRIYSHGGN